MATTTQQAFVVPPIGNANQNTKSKSVYYPKCYIELQILFDGPDSVKNGLVQPQAFTFIPNQCRIYLNSYKEADTFSFSVAASSVHIPMEAIKNGGVKMYLSQSTGMGTPDELFDEPYDMTTGYNENPILVGIIDEIEYSADAENGGIYYHISGRDLTGLLIDRQYPGPKRTPQGQDFGQLIQLLLDLGTGWLKYDDNNNLINGPAQTNGSSKTTIGTRLKAQWLDGTGNWIDIDNLNSFNPITPADTAAKKDFSNTNTKLRTLNQATGKKQPKTSPTKAQAPLVGQQKLNSKGKPRKAKATYWDEIVSQCAMKGYEVFVRGYNVIVANAEALVRTNANTNDYQMVFGANIKKLDIKRSLNKNSVPQVKVFWYDKDKNQSHSVIYPPDSKQAINGITIEQGKIIEVPCHWCNSEIVAKTIAQQYYNDTSRNQGNMSIATNHLTDLSSMNGGTDKDLLKLRVGYPLVIQFADDWTNTYFNKDAGEIQQIAQQIYDDMKLSNLIATYWDVIKDWHNQAFYVKAINYEWDISSGVSVNIELHNYIQKIDDQILEDVKNGKIN